MAFLLVSTNILCYYFFGYLLTEFLLVHAHTTDSYEG